MTQDYYGTKHIKAEVMNRADYNTFRGWSLPADENGADEGYLVEYQDGGKPNVDGRTGYVSWSPKEQFDNAYQATDALSFGHALAAMQQGLRVTRNDWAQGPIFYLTPFNDGYTITKEFSQFSLETAQFSPNDILANDWRVLSD